MQFFIFRSRRGIDLVRVHVLLSLPGAAEEQAHQNEADALKKIRTKQRFFEHNGGVILQQQMQSYSSTGAGASRFNIFSMEELKKATNNFAADQILGRGGHGIVYRGVLGDNSVVAIKKSKMMEEAETKEFTREMIILSQINHQNMVKLLGCCLEVEVPMLVARALTLTRRCIPIFG
jgi:serine/threonine protein kinase